MGEIIRKWQKIIIKIYLAVCTKYGIETLELPTSLRLIIRRLTLTKMTIKVAV